MAQTPTAFDTTVLVDLDSDNGMKYIDAAARTPHSMVSDKKP